MESTDEIPHPSTAVFPPPKSNSWETATSPPTSNGTEVTGANNGRQRSRLTHTTSREESQNNNTTSDSGSIRNQPELAHEGDSMQQIVAARARGYDFVKEKQDASSILCANNIDNNNSNNNNNNNNDNVVSQETQRVTDLQMKRARKNNIYASRRRNTPKRTPRNNLNRNEITTTTRSLKTSSQKRQLKLMSFRAASGEKGPHHAGRVTTRKKGLSSPFSFDVMQIVRDRAQQVTEEVKQEEEVTDYTTSMNDATSGTYGENDDISRVGAYLGRPGGSLQRADDSRRFHRASFWSSSSSSLMAAPNSSSVQRQSPPPLLDLATSPAASGLVEAVPVVDESEQVIAEAHPVDPHDKKQTSTRKQKEEQQRIIKCCLLLGVTALAVILGVFFGAIKPKSSNSTSSNFVQGTTSPTMPTTPSPTVAPSSVLDTFKNNLPNYTLESLKHFSSPQSRAYEWLLGHPNIMNMPVWRKTQLFALVTFFYAFDGESWRDSIQNDWLLYDKSECLWFSSEVGFYLPDDEGDKKYVELDEPLTGYDPCNDRHEFQALVLEDLELYNANPVIPPEIALLTSLKAIDLSYNSINASLDDILPTYLYQMTSLGLLQFSVNSIFGTLPTSLGLLRGLEVLELGSNMFTGWIPSEVGVLTNMKVLLLNNNFLSGPLPSTDLEALTKLESLWLSNNFFSAGQLGFLAHLLNLQWLDVGSLMFTGQIPTKLFLLTNLTTLELYNNSFSGTLSTNFGRLTNLFRLNLSQNLLEGSLPSELGLLTNLFDLHISKNALSSSLPSELGSLSNLEMLDLSSNFFNGSIKLLDVTGLSLTYLSLGSNKFSGVIATELGLLTSLELLDLSNLPLLSGTIPAQISSLASQNNLSYFNISGSNQLSGMIPQELCGLGSADPFCIVWVQGHSVNCSVDFDCTSRLCGCDCPCNASLSCPNNTCA